MNRPFDLVAFLMLAALISILWGRVNRIGYGNFVTAIVQFIMKYSRMNTELLRSYLVWLTYVLVGLVSAAWLFVIYRVNILRFIGLDASWTLIPLTFVAQNSLTALMMQAVLAARPTLNVFAEISRIPWVRYSLIMPGAMRAVSPLVAAVFEELFFRGAVFLILTHRFPETGVYFAIIACTTLFVVQQVLQVDTLGQAVIMSVGSISISVIGCIVTLHTGSFLPTLVCHAAYALFYLQMGSASSNWASVRSIPVMPTSHLQGSKPSSAYSAF